MTSFLSESFQLKLHWLLLNVSVFLKIEPIINEASPAPLFCASAATETKRFSGALCRLAQALNLLINVLLKGIAHFEINCW